MKQSSSSVAGDKTVRLDKWLWAARFFKTRSQATAAVNGGKIHVNEQRCKAGRALQVGDAVRVSKAGLVFDVVVEGLADRRGPAPQAQALYRETPDSIQAREQAQAMQRAARMATPIPDGRPDKRERRALQRFKSGD